MPRLTSQTGKGGKSFQDRELAAKVRTKLLHDLYDVLNDSPKIKKWGIYKKQVILKMANNALPKLNEHSGVDGQSISVTFANEFSLNSPRKAKANRNKSS